MQGSRFIVAQRFDGVVACLYDVLRPIRWDADGLEICRASDRIKFLRTHLWEEEYFLDAVLIGQHHGEAVDTDTQTGGWRHAVFKGTNEVLVDKHGFVVPFF